MGWTGGYLLLAVFLGPYLRQFGAYTIPDFLGARFGGNQALFAPGAVDKLKLSTEQKDKVEKLVKEFEEKAKDATAKAREAMQKAIQDQNRDAIKTAVTEMREKAEKVRDDYLGKVGALLTDEQKKTLEEIKKERPQAPPAPNAAEDQQKRKQDGAVDGSVRAGERQQPGDNAGRRGRRLRAVPGGEDAGRGVELEDLRAVDEVAAHEVEARRGVGDGRRGDHARCLDRSALLPRPHEASPMSLFIPLLWRYPLQVSARPMPATSISPTTCSSATGPPLRRSSRLGFPLTRHFPKGSKVYGSTSIPTRTPPRPISARQCLMPVGQ